MKFANAAEKSLASFDFQPNQFAYFILSRHHAMQQALFDCLLACVNVWAARYDSGEWKTDEELNLWAKAKRVQDAIYFKS